MFRPTAFCLRRTEVPGTVAPPAPIEATPSRDTIKDRVSIHERPKKVEARTEGGHWDAISSFASAHGRCSFSMNANRA
jgi:hypothetical protein